MPGRERTVGAVCPRCATTQPVPVSAVAHECLRCSWEWRFAICGTCNTLACTLEYLESWQCRSCGTFNRSWWKTIDAERDAAVVAERRRTEHPSHLGRRVLIAGTALSLVVAAVWFVIPRESAEEREQAAASTACRRFDQLRRDEASGALTRVALLAELEALKADATGAPPAVREGAAELADAAAAGTDSPRFPAAMTSLADACRGAGGGAAR